MSTLVERTRQAGQWPAVCTVLDALGVPVAAGLPESLDALATCLEGGPPDVTWLALAVLTGELPDEATVLRTVRSIRLDGPLPGLAAVLGRTRRGHRRVEVCVDEVLVDVHHTAQTSLATGIQRVARCTSQVWERSHQPRFVAWTGRLDALRTLDPAERRRALHGGAAVPTANEGVVIVPWRCRYVLPELLTEPERAGRLLAMLRFSGNRGAMIGFDCTPVSSAETVAAGMAAGFTGMLAAMAWGHRIAAISDAAAAEYRGWRTMLAGAGLPGPEISAVSLATEAAGADGGLADAGTAETGLVRDIDVALDGLFDLGLVGGFDPALPLVLCVGSHEPRKNHLAVLHAAEVLWDAGERFALLFVGGNSWRSEEFVAGVDRARAAGRPVRTITALADAVLAAAYRRARLTVFPSWNEGFGLPVAESLAAGTPVLTSRWGSTAEIAAHGGALLVDPRDDDEIIDGLRRLLLDDELHAELVAHARSFPTRTWVQYALETWEYLVTSDVDVPRSAGVAL